MWEPEPVSVKNAYINNADARRYAADLTAAHSEAILLKIELIYIFSLWGREIYCQNATIKTIWNNIIENYINIRFFIRTLKDELFVTDVQKID